MKLEIGDIIEIRGKEATVCYETTYEGRKYICVAFTEDKVQYDIYKYKYEGKKLLVAKVEDEEELTEVLKIFVQEGIEEYGVPEEIKPIIDYYEKHNPEIQKVENE